MATKKLTIWAAFFCSGAAGLIFELIWFRQFAWVLGNTVWSATAVLAAFMAGLCAGYAVALRYQPSPKRAIQSYILIELIVAVTGLLLVMLIPVLPEQLAGSTQAQRFFIACSLMLIPTIAMGMTLPLLVSALSDVQQGKATVGGLYGWNTLGAVSGILVAEYSLIPVLGLSRSAVIASVLNLLAAISVSGLLKHSAANSAQQRIAEKGASAQLRIPPSTLALLMTLAAGTGLLVMVAEVAGFRLLLLYLRGSSEAFAWMLATVLVGLGLGALVSQRYPSNEPTKVVHALLMMSVFLAFGYILTASIASLDVAASTLWLILPATLLLPMSVLSGWLLPALVGWCQSQSKDESRATAYLFLVNTAGAAVGAILAGLVLLPAFGVERSLMAAVTVSLVLAALAALFIQRSLPKTVWSGVSLLLVIVSGLLMLHGPVYWHHHLQFPAKVFLSQDAVGRVAVREGVNETAQLLRRDFMGAPIAWRLITNSHSMSNTERDSRRYMKLYVWLPMLLSDDMESALLISYGTGSTARAMTDDAQLKQIDIVDPSEAVLSLSPIIHGAADPLADGRVRVHIEDGRHYLQTSKQGYDLITGEPPPPRLAGIVNLYTAEYFALMHGRLKPGGWASYWLPVDQLSMKSSKAIVQAFCQNFSDCSLWAGSNYNWMLIGSRGAESKIQSQGLYRLWGSGQQAELQATGLEHPALIGAGFIADANQLAAWVERTPPLQDNHPGRLQPEAADEFALREYQAWSDPVFTRKRFAESAWVKQRWPQKLFDQTIQAFDLQPVLNNEISIAERPWFATSLAGQILDDETLKNYKIPALWLLGAGVDELSIAMRVSAADNNTVNHQQAAFAVVNGQPQRALELLQDVGQPMFNQHFPLALLASCRAGQESLARQWLTESGAGSGNHSPEKTLGMLGCH